MALSQIQKKFLSKMISSPEEALQDIKDNKISLDSFQDQYFQDGTGFTHTLMVQYMHYPEKFEALMHYVLLHSTLSFAEQKGRTSSALTDLLKEDNYPHAVSFMLRHAPHQFSDYDFASGMKILLKTGKIDYKKDFISFLDQKDSISSSNFSSIIEQSIIRDDLELLEQVIAKIDNFEPQYIAAISLKRGNGYSQKETSNLLVLAIRHSPSISNFFLDNYKFPMSGKISERHTYHSIYSSSSLYGSYRSAHKKNEFFAISPLLESYYSNREKIFSRVFDIEQLNRSIPMEIRITLLDKILQEQGDFYHLTKKKILKCENFPDHQTLYSILKSDISLEDKLKFTQYIAPRTPEGLNKILLLNSFFTKIYQDTIKDDDIDSIGKIFSVLYHSPSDKNEYQALDIFKIPLINHSLLFKNLVAHGYDLSGNMKSKTHEMKSIADDSTLVTSHEPCNPFSYYFKNMNNLHNHDLFKFFEQIDHKESSNTFTAIKTLYPKETMLEINHASPLEIALTKLDAHFISQLAPKDFESENPLKYLTRPIASLVPAYTEICHLLHQNGVSFFNQSSDDEHKKYYPILSFCTDYSLIDKILEKENITIRSLCEDAQFWHYINHPDIADYVAKKDANYSTPQIAADLMHADDIVFNLYIQHGGNPYFKEGDNNLLHLLVKNKQYSKSTCLLNQYPALAQEMNEHKKIPLSYFFVDFNRLCRDNYQRHEMSHTYEFKEAMKFFNAYMNNGRLNNHPKTKKMIAEQIDKYSDIKKFVPDIDALILYKTIDSQLEEKNTPVKKIKI